ncbi:hypothetical protein EX30DRAFT_368312 [Ascodesmis nigricans]|uniref:FAD-binding FR-type domain-containing protein n=1 Tax=Ascodesmis nigricans TaxID=341454 RepID=A0A4S2N7C5_9PEZI|nr:hypothetical protein EX30DRAFT_368312 [Ascodesmis nigricans]
MTTARKTTPSTVEECDLSSAIPSAPTGLPTTSVPAPHHKADGTLTPRTEKAVEDLVNKMKTTPVLGIDFTSTRKPRRVTTAKASQLMKVGTSQPLFRDIEDDSSATNLLEGSKCCGGGCCRISGGGVSGVARSAAPPFALPTNDAFKSLNLNLAPLRSRSRLSGIAELPECTVRIESLKATKCESTVFTHPPKFVQPHPPFDVYSARIEGARELTRPGAPKRTYHFDLDVTDYPEEQTGVDFRVGGAIGVTAPNDFDTVDAIFDLLRVSAEERDEPVTLHTTGGRWPTIWGEPEARSLETTRRELLTWTVDIQSTAPTKKLLRVLAEYAEDENEKTILLYLCSKQGQAAFCELRTGPHISLEQLLRAFPSVHPPLHHLLSTLQQLMPRFYSLSADPHFTRPSSSPQKRIIEIAVTVHETPENYRPGDRTGVGSGFFERQAKKFIAANESTSSSPTSSSSSSSSSNLTDSFDSLSLSSTVDIRIPIFRGLMANPLARDFTADGPMLLIGAGVGIAPFRGFVQRRLQNANCVNKVWVLQGVRDSLLDELYSGEWGVSDTDIKKVVESRRGTGRYVQEEVKAQKELVWSVVNAVDGRVFVCGSSKGMGEGVERALVEVAMEMGRLDESQAVEFWKCKKDGGQYIAETW